MRKWWIALAVVCCAVVGLIALQPIPCSYIDEHPTKTGNTETGASAASAPASQQGITPGAEPQRATENSQYPGCNSGASFLARWLIRVVEDPLALFTLLLWWATARLVSDAKASSRLELRAYVSADLGQASYQDNVTMFGSSPVIYNTGNTPARKVSHWCKAAILPSVLPKGYQFPQGTPQVTDVGMSPRHNYVLYASLGRFCTLEEIVEIARGDPIRFYVWGCVTYEDIFGHTHTTRFCHAYRYPVIGGKVTPMADYHPTHNRAD
jgi:hypothetical protein